jgi:hypothetical protein
MKDRKWKEGKREEEEEEEEEEQTEGNIYYHTKTCSRSSRMYHT